MKAVAANADVNFIQCDLADLRSAAAAGDRLAKAIDRLDWVICCAGIMATPAALTKDGYEVQFATNHLGHAMMLRRLLPTLQETAKLPDADVRVVFLSSLGFHFAFDIDFATLHTKQEAVIFGGYRRYGQSKLANILYPAELARRHPDITFASVHPGVIKTGLISTLSTFNYYFTELTTLGMQVTVQEGIKNHLWAASVDKSDIASGEFYVPVGKPGSHTKASKDEQLAKKLYDWTEKALDKVRS